MLEPHRTSAETLRAPSTPLPCRDVVGEGSAQSNHPEVMRNNSLYLAISARMSFEKVR